MTEPMLGRQVAVEEYGGLDTFPVDRPVRVKFTTNELQSLCPAVPGIQPDIYEASIEYTAVTHAIESKSLKLWFVTFRDRRIFAEHLAIEMHDTIAALAPQISDVRVSLKQNTRGGIVTEVLFPA
jgi:NADPH-dependent 7-cyano-7-deazaguanine reductase QueF